MKTKGMDGWLAAAVLGHLLVTFVHGAAHLGADVGLSRQSGLFVLLVIEIAPIVGLAISVTKPHVGGGLVAASMAAALVFGLVNHFLIAGPDHVSHVVVDWRPLFAASAMLLVASEAAGVLAGLWSMARPLEKTS